MTSSLRTQYKDSFGPKAPASKDGYYIPTECKKGFTVFAETNDVFKANGINNFDALLQVQGVVWQCRFRFAQHDFRWYDYFRNNNIEVDMSSDYTKQNNVVNMFVSYHILKTAVNANVLAFKNNTHTTHGCTGDAYDYTRPCFP